MPEATSGTERTGSSGPHDGRDRLSLIGEGWGRFARDLLCVPEIDNSPSAVVNIVDAVLAAVLCMFAVRGYVKGLFREVFALLGLSVGFIVSLRYYEQLSLRVDSWPYSPLILQVIVFVLLFLLIYIALNWVGLMLHRSASLLFLGGINRLGGLLVGGSKGALFLGVGLFFALSQSWIPQGYHQPLGKAALAGPLLGFGAWAVAKGAAVTRPGTSGTDSATSDPQRGA